MKWRKRPAGALTWILFAAGCASRPTTPVEPTLEDKLARIMKLEDERSLGEGEVEARLLDPAGRLRGRAALALARIGDPGAAEKIAPLLTDPSAFVRSTAAFALGIVDGELPPDVLSQLSEAIEDEHENVRARAIEALGKKGGEPEAEVIGRKLSASMPRGAEPYEWADDMHVSALSYPNFDLRLGLFALARLSSLRNVWGIIATEGQTPRFVWWPAAWATSTLPGEERAPLLRFYAGSRNPEFRFWGARGLRSTSIDQAKDYMRLLMADPNERVRIEAVRGAASHGMHELAADIITLLDRDTRYVQAEAMKALAVLRAPGSVEILIDHLGSESRWIRGLALPALAKQDPDGFWLLLAGLGADEDWEVRAELADLLGRLKADRSPALLRTMTEDGDARVRARALRALSRRDAEGAATFLIPHLTAEDPFERVAAAAGLAHIGATDAVAPVKQAFLVEEDSEPGVKAALLQALFELDAEEGQSTARQAIDDTDYLVRLRSAAILKRGGASDVLVRPRPSDRSLETYLPDVSPQYTPQAFIRTSRGGTIELELFVLDAPQTVRNFVRLAREGFYDGLSFHRVVPNDLIQGGDPRGDGNGGPGYTIRSEINERPIVRGTVAMADHGKDTAGSQFFITHLPRPDLDGHHTVFAQVTSGMEIVDRIEPGDTILEVTIWDGVTSPYREP